MLKVKRIIVLRIFGKYDIKSVNLIEIRIIKVIHKFSDKIE